MLTNRTNLPYVILCSGLLALASLAGGCQTDDSDLERPYGGQGDEDGATVSMVLHCSDEVKNAKGTEIISSAEEHGFGNEVAINKARVYFYDSKTKLFFMQKDLEDIKYNPAYSSDTYDISYVSSTFKIRKGTYDIFVIANMDTETLPDRVSRESDFLNTIDTKTYNAGLITTLPTKGLVMSNRADSRLGVEIYDSEAHREISIDLERAVAKMSFGQDKTEYHLIHDGVNYATVNITNFKVVNAPRQYYIFRHVARLTSFTKPDHFTLEDNFGELTDGTYLIDPLFFSKDKEVSDKTAFSDYYEGWYGNKAEDEHASMPTPPSKAVFYLLENAMYDDCQKKAYVTGVLMKGAITPTMVYCYNPITGQVEINGNQEQWTDRLYFHDFKFFDSVKSLNTITGLTLDESKDGTYTDAELSTYKVKQIVRNLGVYESKYSYWIKYNDNADDDMSGHMEHAIVRNNYYKLTLKDITGIGPSQVIVDESATDVEPNKYVDE